MALAEIEGCSKLRHPMKAHVAGIILISSVSLTALVVPAAESSTPLPALGSAPADTPAPLLVSHERLGTDYSEVGPATRKEILSSVSWLSEAMGSGGRPDRHPWRRAVGTTAAAFGIAFGMTGGSVRRSELGCSAPFQEGVRPRQQNSRSCRVE